MGLKVDFAQLMMEAVDMVVILDKWNHYDNKASVPAELWMTSYSVNIVVHCSENVKDAFYTALVRFRINLVIVMPNIHYLSLDGWTHLLPLHNPQQEGVNQQKE